MSLDVRLKATIITDPRVTNLSDPAFRLWVNGLAWSVGQLTDGAIPTGALRFLGVRGPAKYAAELVAAGLWLHRHDKFVIENFAKHQSTREQIEAKRSSWREAQQKHRAGQKANDAPESPDGHTDVIDDSSLTSRKGKQQGESEARSLATEVVPAADDGFDVADWRRRVDAADDDELGLLGQELAGQKDRLGPVLFKELSQRGRRRREELAAAVSARTAEICAVPGCGAPALAGRPLCADHASPDVEFGDRADEEARSA